MNVVRDIQSLSIFKRDASKIIKQIKATKAPVVLTVNGVAEVVVQDAASYQELIDSRERAESVAILRKQLKAFDDGEKGVPMEEVFQNIAKKHGFTLDK